MPTKIFVKAACLGMAGLACVFFASCSPANSQNSNGNSSGGSSFGNLQPSNYFATPTTSSGTSSGGSSLTGAPLNTSQLQNTLSAMPQQSEQQTNAINSASNAVANLEEAENGLSSGTPASLEAYAQALQGLGPVSPMLQEAQYEDLANLFEYLSSLVPVFFYSYSGVARTYATTSLVQFPAPPSFGTPDGPPIIAYYLFRQPSGIFQLPAYNCLDLNGNYELVVSNPQCDGGSNRQNRGVMGYLSANQVSAIADRPLIEQSNNQQSLSLPVVLPGYYPQASVGYLPD